MIDDIIHSSQFYIKDINRAILTNLQHRPFKLGRLIIRQNNTYGCSHGISLFSSPHLLDFKILDTIS